LQKLVQKFYYVETYGEFVQAEFQETTVRRWRFEKVPLTDAERNRIYLERKKHKREDAAQPSTSADISNSDPNPRAARLMKSSSNMTAGNSIISFASL
jgi:hypothetical protein